MPPALTTARYTPQTVADGEPTHGSWGVAAYLRTQHQKASRALVLGQGDAAWAVCCVAIQHCSVARLGCDVGDAQARQACCRMWILYICVLGSLTELADADGELRPKRAALPHLPASARQLWRSITAAYGGHAADVDSEVLVPAVLLALKLRDAGAARDIVEAWLPSRAARDPDHALLEPQQQASYLRVCELYALHILPQLAEFDAARAFLCSTPLISPHARDGLARRLDLQCNPPPQRPRIRRKTRPAPRPTRLDTAPVSTALVAPPTPRSARKALPLLRRLLLRWGLTLFSVLIAAAVLRLAAMRLRLPSLLALAARRLWSTVKMGTQVTYI